MHLQKKYIIIAKNYLSFVGDGGSFRVAYKVRKEDFGILKRMGFSEYPKQGETILPTGKKAVIRYNADGKYIVHNKLPKVERFVHDFEWSYCRVLNDGSRRCYTQTCHQTRMCYPRTFVLPVGVELTYVKLGDEIFIQSPVLEFNEEDTHHAKHVVNLFLALFGECEIRKQDMTAYFPIKTERRNWKFLPQSYKQFGNPGKGGIRLPKVGNHPLVYERQAKILKMGPDKQLIGQAGFSNYVAYIFEEKNIVILESVKKDNALYVFDENWEEFAQKSKRELHQEKGYLKRITHAKGWEKKLKAFMLSLEVDNTHEVMSLAA